MFLFELEKPTPLSTKLVAITAQLRSRIEKESSKKSWKPWSKDKLLNYLDKNGISLSDSDLFQMVKKAPLKNLISNINDKQVTFKGIDGNSGEETAKTKDKKKDTVAKMAKSANNLPQTGPATPPLPDLAPPAAPAASAAPMGAPPPMM